MVSNFSASTITITRHVGLLAGALIALLGVSPVMAADLPFFPAGPNQFKPGPARGTFGGLVPEPNFVGPPRFDVYGHPIYGPVVASAPNPVYASTGCPTALQPVYDAVGNFAGYSMIQLCR